MLRIEVEYLASAEKNDVAAFACWLEGLRLVPPFSSCGLVLYLDSRTTCLHSTATAKRRPLTTSARTRMILKYIGLSKAMQHFYKFSRFDRYSKMEMNYFNYDINPSQLSQIK
jgi:hypothetical protein